MAHVAIVIAVYEPNIDYLKAQLDSIAAQTHQDFTCICMGDGNQQAVLDSLANDYDKPQFIFVNDNQHLGVFHRFEAGIKHALNHVACDYIALCDQDDIWHAEKIATQLQVSQTHDADLVHSNARIINAKGKVTHNSMFAYEKRHNSTQCERLLIRNNVTGMTIFMKHSLAKACLPFPEQGVKAAYLHDLWIALIASITGTIHYTETPLVDYRQHGGNHIGVASSSNVIKRKGGIGNIVKLLTDKSYYIGLYQLGKTLFNHANTHLPQHNIAQKHYTLKSYTLPHDIGQHYVLYGFKMMFKGDMLSASTAWFMGIGKLIGGKKNR